MNDKKIIHLKNGAEVVVNLDMCKPPHAKITRTFNEFKTHIGRFVEACK